MATYYQWIESPTGRLLLVADEAGLRQVAFAQGRTPARVDSAWENGGRYLREPIRQLRAFFAGDLEQFDLLLQPEARQMGIQVSNDRLGSVLRNEIQMPAEAPEDYEERLRVAVANFLLVETAFERAASTLREAAGRLDTLSPLAVLGRGYAVAWDAAKTRVLRDAATVTPGEAVRSPGSPSWGTASG